MRVDRGEVARSEVGATPGPAPPKDSRVPWMFGSEWVRAKVLVEGGQAEDEAGTFQSGKADNGCSSDLTPVMH